MALSPNIGVWIAALLTLGIFSFLYKDNPVYKFCEHLFVGVRPGTGWSSPTTLHQADLIDPLFASRSRWTGTSCS